MTEHRDEAKAAPCTTETRTNGIRRGGGGAPCCLHCLSSRSVQHHTETSPLSPWFLQWGKKDQGGHPMPPALWVTAWGPPLQAYPTGTARGLYRAWLLGMGKWWRRARGFQKLVFASWQQSPCLYHPTVVPASSFAHFQNQESGTVHPEKWSGHTTAY